jgi:nitrite reductase (NAD(P)H)
MVQVTNIFNAEMKKAGRELDNNLCSHFALSRADLFNIVRIKKLRDFMQIMEDSGVHKDSIGCEICKPAVGSILSSM